MKIHSKTWLNIVLLVLALQGCNDRVTNKATVSIKGKTQLNAPIKISRSKYLVDTTLYESKTDTAGSGSFELPLSKSMFVTIQIGEKYGELYVSPGYNLLVEENGQDYTVPLTFSGKGAEINNYVSWVNSNVEKIKWANGRGLCELDINEYRHRFDSLKTTINRFHNSYIDSVTLSRDEVAMLEYKNNIKFLAIEQECKCYKLNTLINQKWEVHENGLDFEDGNATKEIESLTNEIPFDAALLTDGFSDYQVLLNFYWQNEINLPVMEKLISNDSGNLPLMTYDLISKTDYPDHMREFLTAFNVHYWLAVNGIMPETDSIFSDFKRTYLKSNYSPALNKLYNEWLALSPGKSTPEFIGYTREGEKVSISDLKGKIVYMDVWATWCGPCIAEVPASKKLQRDFLNNDRIQFLNVSVDGDKYDWEKFLTEDNTWKGLHVRIEQDKLQSFYSSFKLFGIPAYILIDPAGKIVNVKAPRPSEKKAKEEIDLLLARGR
jgi:thiol-disulfide isomerase/thioredoxin